MNDYLHNYEYMYIVDKYLLDIIVLTAFMKNKIPSVLRFLEEIAFQQ